MDRPETSPNQSTNGEVFAGHTEIKERTLFIREPIIPDKFLSALNPGSVIRTKPKIDELFKKIDAQVAMSQAGVPEGFVRIFFRGEGKWYITREIKTDPSGDKIAVDKYYQSDKEEDPYVFQAVYYTNKPGAAFNQVTLGKDEGGTPSKKDID